MPVVFGGSASADTFENHAKKAWSDDSQRSFTFSIRLPDTTPYAAPHGSSSAAPSRQRSPTPGQLFARPRLQPLDTPQRTMECTLAASYSPSPPTAPTRIKYMKSSQDRTSGKSCASRGQVLRVNFEPGKGEVQERKKKYLTAKYGQHQMSLIRKRLRVEMWMFDQLQALYGQKDEKTDSYDVEIDLDELLDIEGDYKRKEWLGGKVIGAKISPENVEKFISELLQRAKTL